MPTVAHKQLYSSVPSRVARSKKLGGGMLLSLATMVLAVLGGAVAEVFGPASVRSAFQSLDLASVEGLSAVLIAFLSVLTLHECGHLAAAIGMQFEILGVAFGPFRFSRLHGCKNWRFVPGNLFAASISALPMNDRHWRTRMLSVIAAGPIVSLLSIMSALFLLPYLELGSWFYLVLNAIVSLNCVIFFVGLVPNGGYARTRNDAQLFWCILRNSGEAQELNLYQRLMRARVTGVRPRDYPADLTQSLAQSQGRPDMCMAFAEALMKWAVDCGDLEKAKAWQEKARQLMMNSRYSLNNVGQAESGFFDLLLRQDAQSARDTFSKVRFREISPAWLRHRLIAAARVAEGNRLAAHGEIDKAILSLPHNVPHGDFERDLLLKLGQVSPGNQQDVRQPCSEERLLNVPGFTNGHC